MNIYIPLALSVYKYSIYKLIYGKRRGGGERLDVILTLPVLSQIVRFEGQAANSLIQLMIALMLRDQLLLLAVLECLCEI